jgi:hypothetical protein
VTHGKFLEQSEAAQAFEGLEEEGKAWDGFTAMKEVLEKAPSGRLLRKSAANTKGDPLIVGESRA